MRANPPIKGHTLIGEGHIFPIHEGWEIVGHSGGCSCGAKPPRFPNVSMTRMRLWHREHKEELRATMNKDEKLTPERAVRLLYAKAGELEARVEPTQQMIEIADIALWMSYFAADIALVAQLLADHIEWGLTQDASALPGAGWLRDPHDTSASPGERWWDGTDFTHLTRLTRLAGS